MAGVEEHQLIAGRRVVVLGATGWLGMVALDLLESMLGELFDAQVSAWASRERAVELRSGRTVAVRALADAQPSAVAGAVVLHFAFLTRDRVAEMGADAFTAANRGITNAVLSLFEGAPPRAVVYASSGVAAVADEPYAAAKRHDEGTFRLACSDLGASCVIPRIFSVSGPYMTKPSLYALGDLILQAQREERLRIRAAHPVIRSYVAAGDLLALCLAASLDDRADLLFDSGGEEVEVGDLAEIVRAVAGRPDLPIERTWDPTAPADRYVGDAAAIDALARRVGISLQPLAEQVAVTAADLARASRA